MFSVEQKRPSGYNRIKFIKLGCYMKTKKKLHRPFSLKQYMILVLSSLIIITTLILLIFPTKLYEELYYQQTENYCKNMIIQTCTGISDT